MRLSKYIFVSIIALFIYIPTCLTFCGIDIKVDLFFSKYGKHPKPSYSGDIVKYFVGYYKYFNDNLFARDLFKSIYNNVTFYYFNNFTLLNGVIVGKDHFLFGSVDKRDEYTLEYKGSSMADRQGFVHIPQEVLSTRFQGIINFNNWLKKHNISLYLVMVPDKEAIYTDKLPEWIKIQHGVKTSVHQIMDYLSYHGVKCINLEIPFLPYKDFKYEIYYKTDSHWNKLGAYIGYTYIIENISKDFKQLKPVLHIDINNIQFTPYYSNGELFWHFGIKEYPYYREAIIEYPKHYTVIENNNELLIKTIGPQGLPRAVVYRDSAGVLLVPLLANNFSYAVFIWEYLWKTNTIDTEMILREKPDIVIIEQGGRYYKYWELDFKQ